MATLTIRFSGICTHFRGVVPGVPHRAVLPDAASVRFGHLAFDWDEPETSRPYYIVPHFAHLRTSDLAPLTVRDVMLRGVIYSGARLQILNPLNDALTYEEFEDIPSVTQFVSQYSFSNDVVMGGRAACYFDVHAGYVTREVLANGLKRVLVTIETDGVPILEVTPFRSALKPTRIALENITELGVANLEVNPKPDDPPFDYLLHYLTERGGIPPRLVQPTPGMPLTLPVVAKEKAAEAMHDLAHIVAAGWPPWPEELAKVDPEQDTMPSCSDSRYP